MNKYFSIIILLLLFKSGGCDNILYSSKRNDNCGICGGNNDSCEEISKMIEAPTTYGEYFFFAPLAFSSEFSIYLQFFF